MLGSLLISMLAVTPVLAQSIAIDEKTVEALLAPATPGAEAPPPENTEMPGMISPVPLIENALLALNRALETSDRATAAADGWQQTSKDYLAWTKDNEKAHKTKQAAAYRKNAQVFFARSKTAQEKISASRQRLMDIYRCFMHVMRQAGGPESYAKAHDQGYFDDIAGAAENMRQDMIDRTGNLDDIAGLMKRHPEEAQISLQSEELMKAREGLLDTGLEKDGNGPDPDNCGKTLKHAPLAR